MDTIFEETLYSSLSLYVAVSSCVVGPKFFMYYDEKFVILREKPKKTLRINNKTHQEIQRHHFLKLGVVLIPRITRQNCGILIIFIDFLDLRLQFLVIFVNPLRVLEIALQFLHGVIEFVDNHADFLHGSRASKENIRDIPFRNVGAHEHFIESAGGRALSFIEPNEQFLIENQPGDGRANESQSHDKCEDSWTFHVSFGDFRGFSATPATELARTALATQTTAINPEDYQRNYE